MIKLKFNEEELIVKMYDNETSKDFLKLLPIKLVFQDYDGTEKVSSLPRKLSLENAVNVYDPEIGDLALYAPFGNLCIFYNDFRYAQ